VTPPEVILSPAGRECGGWSVREKITGSARCAHRRLLGRWGRGRAGTLRKAGRDDQAHLRAWAAAHEGVEAFVEPRTTVTDTTMLLVDKDGDHTRRRIGGPDAARKLARSLAIPVYDVQLLGYPKRMRDHDARQKILRERERRRALGEG
jgi:hypothetical protein